MSQDCNPDDLMFRADELLAAMDSMESDLISMIALLEDKIKSLNFRLDRLRREEPSYI